MMVKPIRHKSIGICIFFRYGQFSIIAGEWDRSTYEGTEQEVNVAEIIMVRLPLLVYMKKTPPKWGFKL